MWCLFFAQSKSCLSLNRVSGVTTFVATFLTLSLCSRQHGNAFPENRIAEQFRNTMYIHITKYSLHA